MDDVVLKTLGETVLDPYSRKNSAYRKEFLLFLEDGLGCLAWV